MDLLTLAVACGHLVHPATTLRVIETESRGHVYAIHDNTSGAQYDPANLRQAAGLARNLISLGHNLDLGLMQINEQVWLRPIGFPLERALSACTNIRLGTTILSANYAQALSRAADSTDALMRALSLYNSGSETRALGYAVRVLIGEDSGATHAGRTAGSAERARLAPVGFSTTP